MYLHLQHTSVQTSHISSAHSCVQLAAAIADSAVLQLNRLLSPFAPVLLPCLCLWINPGSPAFPFIPRSLSSILRKSHLHSPYDLIHCSLDPSSTQSPSAVTCGRALRIFDSRDLVSLFHRLDSVGPPTLPLISLFQLAFVTLPHSFHSPWKLPFPWRATSGKCLAWDLPTQLPLPFAGP